MCELGTIFVCAQLSQAVQDVYHTRPLSSKGQKGPSITMTLSTLQPTHHTLSNGPKGVGLASFENHYWDREGKSWVEQT